MPPAWITGALVAQGGRGQEIPAVLDVPKGGRRMTAPLPPHRAPVRRTRSLCSIAEIMPSWAGAGANTRVEISHALVTVIGEAPLQVQLAVVDAIARARRARKVNAA